MYPWVDVYKCNGCGVCVRQCPVNIIGLVNKKAAILLDLCEECGICAFVCPEVAIKSEIPDGGYNTINIPYMTRR